MIQVQGQEGAMVWINSAMVTHVEVNKFDAWFVHLSGGQRIRLITEEDALRVIGAI